MWGIFVPLSTQSSSMLDAHPATGIATWCKCLGAAAVRLTSEGGVNAMPEWIPTPPPPPRICRGPNAFCHTWPLWGPNQCVFLSTYSVLSHLPWWSLVHHWAEGSCSLGLRLVILWTIVLAKHCFWRQGGQHTPPLTLSHMLQKTCSPAHVFLRNPAPCSFLYFRYNLDPFESHSDEMLWQVLERTFMRDTVGLWGSPGWTCFLALGPQIPGPGLNWTSTGPAFGQAYLLASYMSIEHDPYLLSVVKSNNR